VPEVKNISPGVEMIATQIEGMIPVIILGYIFVFSFSNLQSRSGEGRYYSLANSEYAGDVAEEKGGFVSNWG
jgi:hypothetical protein